MIEADKIKRGVACMVYGPMGLEFTYTPYRQQEAGTYRCHCYQAEHETRRNLYRSIRKSAGILAYFFVFHPAQGNSLILFIIYYFQSSIRAG